MSLPVDSSNRDSTPLPDNKGSSSTPVGHGSGIHATPTKMDDDAVTLVLQNFRLQAGSVFCSNGGQPSIPLIAERQAVGSSSNKNIPSSDEAPSKLTEDKILGTMQQIQARLKALKNDQVKLQKEFKAIGSKENLGYQTLITKRNAYHLEYEALKKEWGDIKSQFEALQAEQITDPQTKKQYRASLKTHKKALKFFSKESKKKLSKGKRLAKAVAKMVFRERIAALATPQTDTSSSPRFNPKITESLDTVITIGNIPQKEEFGTQTIERFDIVNRENKLLEDSFAELTKKKNGLLAEKEGFLQRKGKILVAQDMQKAELAKKHPATDQDTQEKIEESQRAFAKFAQSVSDESATIVNLTTFAEKVDKQITFIDKELQRIAEKESRLPATRAMKEGDWIGSNYFRDLIRQHGYDRAVELYTAIPVNMRYQSWTGKAEAGHTPTEPDSASAAKPEIGFIRLGVISDLTNGFTSLKELKALATMSTGQRERTLNEKIKQLKNRMAKLDPTKKKDADKIAALKAAISQFEQAKEANHLNNMISERRAVLRDQFAHLVNEQVKKHGTNGDVFQMAHVALLDENKKKLDKTGWMHSELNEMEDMEEIFHEYDGQPIHFADTFHVDEQGGIHIPRPDGTTESSIKLKTSFFNISVGGSVTSRLKKKSYQPEVLEKAMGRLEGSAEGTPHAGTFQSMKARLDKGESTHRTAEDLVFLLHDLKVPFSLGCLSAKDRTKLVGENVIRRFAVKATFAAKNEQLGDRRAQGTKKGNEERVKESTNKLLDKAWTSPDNASSQVLEETSGTGVAKLSPHLVTHISLGAKWKFAKDALWAHLVRPLFNDQESGD